MFIKYLSNQRVERDSGQAFSTLLCLCQGVLMQFWRRKMGIFTIGNIYKFKPRHWGQMFSTTCLLPPFLAFARLNFIEARFTTQFHFEAAVLILILKRKMVAVNRLARCMFYPYWWLSKQSLAEEYHLQTTKVLLKLFRWEPTGKPAGSRRGEQRGTNSPAWHLHPPPHPPGHLLGHPGTPGHLLHGAA